MTASTEDLHVTWTVCQHKVLWFSWKELHFKNCSPTNSIFIDFSELNACVVFISFPKSISCQFLKITIRLSAFPFPHFSLGTQLACAQRQQPKKTAHSHICCRVFMGKHKGKRVLGRLGKSDSSVRVNNQDIRFFWRPIALWYNDSWCSNHVRVSVNPPLHHSIHPYLALEEKVSKGQKNKTKTILNKWK